MLKYTVSNNRQRKGSSTHAKLCSASSQLIRTKWKTSPWIVYTYLTTSIRRQCSTNRFTYCKLRFRYCPKTKKNVRSSEQLFKFHLETCTLNFSQIVIYKSLCLNLTIKFAYSTLWKCSGLNWQWLKTKPLVLIVSNWPIHNSREHRRYSL